MLEHLGTRSQVNVDCAVSVATRTALNAVPAALRRSQVDDVFGVARRDAPGERQRLTLLQSRRRTRLCGDRCGREKVA